MLRKIILFRSNNERAILHLFNDYGNTTIYSSITSFELLHLEENSNHHFRDGIALIVIHCYRPIY